MKRTSKTFILIAALVLVATSACASSTPEAQGNSSTKPAITSTQNAVSLLVLPTALPQPIQPSPASYSAQPTPSLTRLLMTSTVSPDTTLSPSPACSNEAEFVKHLSIGDFTALKHGEIFGKIWQIRNVGTCTWNQDYSLIFVSGDAMDGPQSVSLPHIVEPGKTVDLRARLVAPQEAGTYTGKWMLQDADGNLFGLGEAGDQPIAVNIVTMPTPRPTSGCSMCTRPEDN